VGGGLWSETKYSKTTFEILFIYKLFNINVDKSECLHISITATTDKGNTIKTIVIESKLVIGFKKHVRRIMGRACSKVYIYLVSLHQKDLSSLQSLYFIQLDLIFGEFSISKVG
jgi:hypothetical protein